MKRQGFTLVELLGVIVLLGILGVIIVPKIGDSISNSKKSAYNAQVESIKKGVSDFLVDNSDILSKDGTYEIKLGAIKQGGYLPVDIKNPITRKSFSNESKVIISVVGNKYEMEFNLIDIVDVTENVNGNSPILILNGNYVEYVEVNASYTDLGAIAKSSMGEVLTVDTPQIKQGDNTVDKIDTSNLNTYSVIYTATDSKGNSTTATRTVIVRDSTAPTINIPKDTIVDLIGLSRFDLMNGVVVNDNYDNNVDINISSNIANIPGNYVVTYTATDSSGNTSTERRVINVVDNNYEKIEYVKTNGQQYIEFDYKAKTNTKVELDIELIENDNTNSSIVGNNFLGINNSSAEYFFTCNFGANADQARKIFYWVDKNYDQGGLVYAHTYSEVTNRSIMTVQSGSATFQGVTTQIAIKTADNTSNLVLLGSMSSTLNKMVAFKRYDAKVYGFKIYEDDTLIMDLVPSSTISGIVGLYDLISDNFYTSDGDADFLRE